MNEIVASPVQKSLRHGSNECTIVVGDRENVFHSVVEKVLTENTSSTRTGANWITKFLQKYMTFHSLTVIIIT